MGKFTALLLAIILAVLASLAYIPQDTLSSYTSFLGASGDIQFGSMVNLEGRTAQIGECVGLAADIVAYIF